MVQQIDRKRDEYAVINIGKLKVIFLYRMRICFVGIFMAESNSKLSKLFLSQISIAMANYNIKFDDINNFTQNYLNKVSSDVKQLNKANSTS
jgi:hypothetical protein